MDSISIKIINDYQKHTEWLIAQVKEKNEEIRHLKKVCQEREEAVREYFYDHCESDPYDSYANGKTAGIKGTLDLLGIKIEGVNA